ncbi:hypothetical protein [Celerinatantimonas sp. YJH-8]|uniref:hypothetical protein n=1 Tax=Celerinatantimonas sp. YJH-8 TaxID=3228714 RepID=UPI0038C553EE
MESQPKSSGQSEQPVQYQYNHIFEKLVMGTEPLSNERLVGMIAYADYKDEKYRWKASYREVHNVNDVPVANVADFLLGYNEKRLQKLKDDAALFLTSFAAEYAEDRIEEEKEKAKDSEIIKKIGRQKDGWWVSILKGALGSFAFTVFVFLFSLLFSLAKPGSNYSKLVQFIVGNKDFIVLPVDDCRINNSKNCKKYQ